MKGASFSLFTVLSFCPAGNTHAQSREIKKLLDRAVEIFSNICMPKNSRPWASCSKTYEKLWDFRSCTCVQWDTFIYWFNFPFCRGLVDHTQLSTCKDNNYTSNNTCMHAIVQNPTKLLAWQHNTSILNFLYVF